MAQYIDKDALIAEADRRLDELYNLLPDASKVENGTITISEACNTGKYTALESFKDYVDTLEVKEVDLEKELESWRHNHFHGRRDKEASGEYFERVSQLDLAKHFFELGLQARTDKELVEEVYSHIDGIKDTADRMTSGNFMHNRAAIKFSANTIAKVLELIGLKTQKGE